MRKGGKFKIETILAFSVALELEMPFIVDLMQSAIFFEGRFAA